MRQAYLTIDDSPSKNTDAMVDFLASKNIPALLFARGGFMEDADYFAKIVRAIQKGFVIANHSYAHDRTSVVGFKSQTEQIAQTQVLIDRAYDMAGVPSPARHFRFPHLDRGCGNAWVIDFDTVPASYRDYVISLFRDGVRLETLEPPTPVQLQLKSDMQNWLHENNFVKMPTDGVTFPWWVESELGQAVDALITYSTSDWMMTPRHVGHWPYKDIAALCRKIDDDSFLMSEISNHIILMHDDHEDSLTITENLVTHFLNQNFRFLPF